MASRQADVHIEAQRRLREIVSAAVGTAWSGLGSYDEPDVDRFLAQAVPIADAGRRQSVALTEAYLARYLKRSPFGVEVPYARLRGGADPGQVYRRPFVTVWTKLGEGAAYEQAVKAGLERLTSTAEMDVQLASRATYGAVQEADETIFGYQRVADGGACEFCLLVDGAYVKSGDAMPLHNRCGCGLEPLTNPHPRAATLPSGVAVHDHGELGPVLGDPAHSFTSPSDLQ